MTLREAYSLPGVVCVVDEIPPCDFCAEEGEVEEGPYDFRVVDVGSWAHGCSKHYQEHRAWESLGIGHGQLWVIA